MENEIKKLTIFDGCIINNQQRKLFFEYLGIKLKLPKILMENSALTAIIALILILGAKSSIFVASAGGIMGLLGVTTATFSISTFIPFIAIAAGVFVVGTSVIFVSNRPTLSFKSQQNVILEVLTKFLFLPALILIKQNKENFNRDLNAMLQVLKKQMTDIAYTQEYVEYFFNRYENMDIMEIEKVLANLNISSDALKKKMPGNGKLYSSDYKPALYVEKAIELCNNISQKYCDEIAKQKENEKTIFHLKALLLADEPTLMEKTRDNIDDLRKKFVNKHIFNLNEAEENALALFIEPLIWFLRTPNLKDYWIQIIERKMENLACSKELIEKTVESYVKKTPEEILKSISEKNNFARSNGINTSGIIKIVQEHCKKEIGIYCEPSKDKEPSDEEKLLDILKANMSGKSIKI